MKPRLLLVEDDPTSRAFLLAASAALPVEIETADSIASALRMAAAVDYALWLIDAHLPDGSGGELLARLRARGLSTPAVAHTAARDRAGIDALHAQGFVEVIVKPLSAGQWQQAVSRVLQAGPDASSAAPAEGSEARPASPPPVWDDARALQALKASTAHVAALRGLFIAELAPARDAVATAFTARDADALHASLHRLQASCGFVGAARLHAAVQALARSPGSEAAFDAFRAAVQDTLPPSAE